MKIIKKLMSNFNKESKSENNYSASEGKIIDALFVYERIIKNAFSRLGNLETGDSFDAIEKDLCESLIKQKMADKETEFGIDFWSTDRRTTRIWTFFKDRNSNFVLGTNSSHYAELHYIVDSSLDDERTCVDGEWLVPAVRNFRALAKKIQADSLAGNHMLAANDMRKLLREDYVELRGNMPTARLEEIIKETHEVFLINSAKHAHLANRLKILHSMIGELGYGVELIEKYDVNIKYLELSGNIILRDIIHIQVDYKMAIELMRLGGSEMYVDKMGDDMSLTDLFKSSTQNQGSDQPDWSFELKSILERRKLHEAIGVVMADVKVKNEKMAL